ncbi:tRNA modification GTPase [Crateriforma spongiae]|uniref:tRNA modification GTPase n=1 Tax=Crateriforma spongiae TaxID=2724528 RepID=UPI00144629AE|nr:tRNA modification GTPase [Crateriforma spongiae]
MFNTDDTIVAIASPLCPAPRGIVRLSGDDVMDVLAGLMGGPVDLTAGRRQRAAIDCGAPIGEIHADVLIWPDGRSYTGQPSAEIHTIGSLPVLESMVQRAIQFKARAARPGEFTLRSFLAGRLDLTQAEAVLGVIDADQDRSLDQALQQLAGNFSRPLLLLRDQLLDLLADVEAGLDFVDEDIEFIQPHELRRRLDVIAATLESTSATLESRGESNETPKIVLCGQPNAGKSCLINAISGHDAALVADVPGTTRDTVSVHVTVGDRQLELIDTAGFEAVAGRTAATSDSQKSISEIAQRMTAQAIRRADVVLHCVDVTRPSQSDDRPIDSAGRHVIGVWTKADLQSPNDTDTDVSAGGCLTSSVTGQGIDDLVDRIFSELDRTDRTDSVSVSGTAARCRQSLAQAAGAIRTAIGLSEIDEGQELIATEIRTAADALGEVTGVVYTDDILDRVFGRFCIGK